MAAGAAQAARAAAYYVAALQWRTLTAADVQRFIEDGNLPAAGETDETVFPYDADTMQKIAERGH